MKTKAAVLYDINKPLRIEELEIPELKTGQVLVKVAFSGVCHSQLNEISGKKGEDRFLPHTLGHEGSGIVERVGCGVTKVKVGDHVVLSWIKNSGMDVAYATYNSGNGSVVNSGAISTFMEHAVISENRIVAISKEMPLREASLFGCAFPTGAGIILNTIRPRQEDSLAVFGTGGIGLSSIIAAEIMQCAQIIAVDVYDYKLEIACKSGATNIINAAKEDPVQAIMKLTQDRGVDYAIEAAGLKETMEKAFASIKNDGGVLAIAGNLSHNEKITIDPFELIKGKKIIGSWGGQTQPEKDIPKYVDFYLSGKLKIDHLITHCFKLNEINTALNILRNSDNVGRVLIEF